MCLKLALASAILRVSYCRPGFRVVGFAKLFCLTVQRLLHFSPRISRFTQCHSVKTHSKRSHLTDANAQDVENKRQAAENWVLAWVSTQNWIQQRYRKLGSIGTHGANWDSSFNHVGAQYFDFSGWFRLEQTQANKMCTSISKFKSFKCSKNCCPYSDCSPDSPQITVLNFQQLFSTVQLLKFVKTNIHSLKKG